MIKKYKINGITCPNCAKNLENELIKLETVNSAKIDFIKSNLELEFNNEDAAIKDVLSLVAKIEPNATIILKNKKTNNKKLWVNLFCLLSGLLFRIFYGFSTLLQL